MSFQYMKSNKRMHYANDKQGKNNPIIRIQMNDGWFEIIEGINEIVKLQNFLDHNKKQLPVLYKWSIPPCHGKDVWFLQRMCKG